MIALKKKRDAKIRLHFSEKINVLFYGRISNVYGAVFFKVAQSRMWSGCLHYYKKERKNRLELLIC